MASKEEKKRRRQLVKAIASKQYGEAVSKMPLSRADLKALFEFLDSHDIEDCDHTFTRTIEFLEEHKLDVYKIIPWLNEYGGYCDCEVLLNVTEAWAEEVSLYSEYDDVVEVTSEKMWHKQEVLSLPCGIQLDNIPNGWKLFHVESSEGSYWNMSLGKKGAFRLIIMETALPQGDQDSDPYWIELWTELTGLPLKGDCFVEKEVVSLSNTTLKSVTVNIRGWLPVYRWIYSDNRDSWYMRSETDSIRKQNDFRELSILLSKMKLT